MTKKQMVAELERRMRYFYEQYEHWTEIAKANPDNPSHRVVAEFFKGKAFATEDAMILVKGEK